MARVLQAIYSFFDPENLFLQHELYPAHFPPQVFSPTTSVDNRHDKNMVISPFRQQNYNFQPIEQVPPIKEEEKKSEARQKPRIYLYRWLGQHNAEDERKVTFKAEEKAEKEPAKEVKDATEVLVQSLLDPQVPPDETREYERYPPCLVASRVLI